jgi:hypothetical protein
MRKIILLLFLLAASSLHAATLGILARTENKYQQVENHLFSGDDQINLWAQVNFCIDTNLPKEGYYHFSFEITDPNGVKVTFTRNGVKTTRIDSQSVHVPSTPQYLELREAVPASQVYTVNGQYTLSVYFTEEYSTGPLSTNFSYPFRMDGGSNPTQQTAPPVLLQPADGSIVTSYPNFLWSTPMVGNRYIIYMSDNPVPQETPNIWKQINITENFIIYSGTMALVPGRRYYWNIRVVDVNGNGLGTNLGLSQTFSFFVNNTGVSDKLELIFPRQQNIDNSMPKFRWTSVFPFDVPAEYKLTLSTVDLYDKDKKVVDIWNFTGNTNSYQYQASAPPLQAGVTYFWKVEAFDKRKGSNNTTPEKVADTQFVYVPEKTSSENPANASATSINGVVLNFRDIAVMGASYYFKHTTDPLVTFTGLTGANGSFTISPTPEVPVKPGTYRLFVEKQMTTEYNNYDAEVLVVADQRNDLRIVMKNNTGLRTFLVVSDQGWPVPNAKIILRNTVYTWNLTTDDQGKASLYIEDGYVNYEVRLAPQYARVYKNNVYFKGVGTENVTLPRSQNGAARMKVIEGGTNMGMQEFQIEGEISER